MTSVENPRPWPGAQAGQPRFSELDPHGFADPALTAGRGVIGTAASWVVLGLVALGDFANFYLALAVDATAMTPTTLTMTVLAVTVGSLAVMHFAGTTARARQAQGRRGFNGTVGLLVLVWLLLGLGAFGLRPVSPETPDVDLAESGSGFGLTVTPAPEDHVTLLTSLLLLAVYLAGGAAAAWLAHHRHNPHYDAWHRAARKV